MTESMRSLEDERRVRCRLYRWFDTPLGRSLQAREAHRLREVLPLLYGKVALQLGRIGKMDLLDASPAPTHILLDPHDGDGVRALTEALPFDSRSVDVVLLPHTLDFASDPHQVLREVSRVLTPEGHAVLLGFNPVSLWGLWRLLSDRRRVPWSARFIRLPRVKDWLSLLEFEPTYGSMLYYRPPVRREHAMERLRVLEHVGDRWWPLGAAVYVLVARKRVLGMTRLVPAWQQKRRLRAALGQPAVRVVR